MADYILIVFGAIIFTAATGFVWWLENGPSGAENKSDDNTEVDAEAGNADIHRLEEKKKEKRKKKKRKKGGI